MTCHNKLCDGVADLAGKAFTSLHVRYDPLIHSGCAVREGKAHPAGSLHKNSPVATENSKQKGDLPIRNLCQIGMDSIHDMRVMNTDALSHQNKSSQKRLHTVDKDNKKNYLQSCLHKCLHFSTFVVLVDGLLRVQSEAMLKRTSNRLATKWKHPYS